MVSNDFLVVLTLGRKKRSGKIEKNYNFFLRRIDSDIVSNIKLGD